MQLSGRKHEILCATIDDYIKDAVPITSSAVKVKHQGGVSSATLRNELNALEAMGFLKQLHTSSGRVPTTEGYRYYVESLMKDIKVDEKKLDNIKQIISERTKSVNEIIAELAKLISEATNYPTVIVMNGYDKLILEEIKIVPLIAGQTLILMQTTSGIINNTIEAAASQKSCDDAAKLLTKKFAGKTIEYMTQHIGEIESALQKDVKDYKRLVENIIEGLKEFASKAHAHVKQSGSVKLLESGNIDGTKKVLNLIENENEIKTYLTTEDKNVSVLLSDEEKLAGCAVVKAPIIVGGQTVGTVNVLGPDRMDYSLIAGALKFVSNELENQNLLESEKIMEDAWQKRKKT